MSVTAYVKLDIYLETRELRSGGSRLPFETHRTPPPSHHQFPAPRTKNRAPPDSRWGSVHAGLRSGVPKIQPANHYTPRDELLQPLIVVRHKHLDAGRHHLLEPANLPSRGRVIFDDAKRDRPVRIDIDD